jgi:hypothetical protein
MKVARGLPLARGRKGENHIGGVRELINGLDKIPDLRRDPVAHRYHALIMHRCVEPIDTFMPLTRSSFKTQRLTDVIDELD